MEVKKHNPADAKETLLRLYGDINHNKIECIAITTEQKDDRTRVSFVVKQTTVEEE